jgi:hypothetical protein
MPISRSTYYLTSTHFQTDDHPGHPSPTTLTHLCGTFLCLTKVIGTVPYTLHRRTAKSLRHRTYCVSLSHHQIHGFYLWRPPHVQRVRTIRSWKLLKSRADYEHVCYDKGIKKWSLHVSKASENFTSKSAQFCFTKQVHVSGGFTFIHSTSFYASLIHIPVRIPQTPVSLRPLFKQSLFTVRIKTNILRFA